MTDTTCQICERVIKSKSGLIAHHGYRRPGQGWQTASCSGAKYRPYEVACDAIPPAIAAIDQYRAGQVRALTRLRTEPPEGLEFTIGKSYYGDGRTASAIRPRNFNPEKPKSESYAPHAGIPYGNLFMAREREHTGQIEAAVSDIKRLTRRLGEWRAKAAAQAACQ